MGSWGWASGGFPAAMDETACLIAGGAWEDGVCLLTSDQDPYRIGTPIGGDPSGGWFDGDEPTWQNLFNGTYTLDLYDANYPQHGCCSYVHKTWDTNTFLTDHVYVLRYRTPSAAGYADLPTYSDWTTWKNGGSGSGTHPHGSNSVSNAYDPVVSAGLGAKPTTYKGAGTWTYEDVDAEKKYTLGVYGGNRLNGDFAVTWSQAYYGGITADYVYYIDATTEWPDFDWDNWDWGDENFVTWTPGPITDETDCVTAGGTWEGGVCLLEGEPAVTANAWQTTRRN